MKRQNSLAISHLNVFFIVILLFHFNIQAQDANRTTLVSKQEIYSRVQVQTNAVQFAKMNEQVGFDHIDIQPSGAFIGEFSQTEINKMVTLGVKIKVLVPDLVKETEANNTASRLETGNNAVVLPNGFSYGSMGGYLTYAEIVAKLDELRNMYPNLISIKQSIGKSTENRDLWVVKISDNPDQNENEPKVFYNALIHSREPMSMMEMFYYMCTILQNYNSDPEAKHLIDERELYFMPCVNPDGYEYNRSIAPNGGGMWRKNRFKVTTTTYTVKNCRDVKVGRVCDTIRKGNTYTVRNCRDIKVRVCDTTFTSFTSTYGVDLNRNFGYQWGYDNIGSSNVQTSETYRGTSAFSEPESKAVRDFCFLKNFRYVLNNHSYGNDLIYPYNYAPGVLNADQAYYNLLNPMLTEANGLSIGHTIDVLGYYSNGEANDWQNGEQTLKPKTFSWTPELGSSTDGFWPVQNRIEPLCLDMVKLNTNFAWIGGSYFRFTAPPGLTVTSTLFNVPLSIINYGNSTGTVEKIKFIPNNGNSTGNDSVSLSGIISGATANKNLLLDLSAYAGAGTIDGTLKLIYPDGYEQGIPFSFDYSLPVSIQQENTAKTGKMASRFTIYPNPTTGIVYISSANNDIPYSVSVYNIMGEQILNTSNKNQLDLSGTPTGLYFIQIESAEGIKKMRILKQ